MKGLLSLRYIWVMLLAMALVAMACAPAAAPTPTAAPKPAAAPTKAPEATKPAAPTAAPTKPAAAGAPPLTGTHKMSIATGGTAGTYYPFGGAMGSLWSKHLQGVTVTAESTGASTQNAALLGSKQVELALIQNDIADYAMNGTELFKEKITNVRAIASLYPELMQWVVTPSIKSIADLKGKNFVVGPTGSGTEANTRQIFDAVGMSYKDLGKATFLTFAEAANAYKNRQVDGFAITGGVPTSAITDAATGVDISLLPIAGDTAKRVTDKYRFYVDAKVPANAYKGVTSDVQTVAVLAILVTREDLDKNLVYWLTKTLIEKQSELAQAHAKGKDLSKESAVKGITIPWHPGAEQYYKEIGVMK